MGVISETCRVLDSINFNSVSEGKGIFIFKKENTLKNGSNPLTLEKDIKYSRENDQ